MTRLITALDEISAPYDALFCDLWGCVHDGITAFPGAVAALRTYRARGGRVVLLTNASAPHDWVINGLAEKGVPPDAYDTVVTAGDAAREALMAGAVGQRVYHIGTGGDSAFFSGLPETAPERVDLRAAEGLVVTGLVDDTKETPEDYRSTLLYAKTKGLPMLCANPDLVVDRGAVRAYCAGSIARLYEDMGGLVYWFGKPYPGVYDLARRKLAQAAGRDIEDRKILCLGDGIGTDIAGAQGEGLDSLFITGGLSTEAFGNDRAAPRPDLVREWLRFQDAQPSFAIGLLS